MRRWTGCRRPRCWTGGTPALRWLCHYRRIAHHVNLLILFYHHRYTGTGIVVAVFRHGRRIVRSFRPRVRFPFLGHQATRHHVRRLLRRVLEVFSLSSAWCSRALHTAPLCFRVIRRRSRTDPDHNRLWARANLSWNAIIPRAV